MEAIRIRRPLLIHPLNLHRTALQHSLIALVASSIGVRENEVVVHGRPQNQPCDAIVAMPFLDGRVGFEIGQLMARSFVMNVPVFIIITEHVLSSRHLRHFESNPLSGVFTLRMVSADERRRISSNDPLLVIPPEETLFRVFTGNGDEMWQYEISHTF